MSCILKKISFFGAALFLTGLTILLGASCLFYFQGTSSADESPRSSRYFISAGSFPTSSTYSVSGSYSFYAGLENYPSISISSPTYSLGSGSGKLVFYIAPLGPVALAVDPAFGYNIAAVHINKITGANFAPGLSVKLAMTGENDIPASAITITSSAELSCDFNIAGAKSGLWNVVVVGDGSASTLSKAFEVKSYVFDAVLALNSPNPFDPDKETTAVIYNLAKDSEVDAYIFTITGDLIWKNNFSSGFAGGKAGNNSFTWDGTSYFGEALSNGIYLMHIVDRSTGRTLAKGKIMILKRI